MLVPRSQRINPPVNFKYPLNLRTEAAKNNYKEADGWLDSIEIKRKRIHDDGSVIDNAEDGANSNSNNNELCYDFDSEAEKESRKRKKI